jgi:CRP/FNR family transcriptional regulator, anaerobic regulatory protein
MNVISEFNLFKEQIKKMGTVLSDESIALLTSILKEKSFKKGEIVIHAGEVCTEAYFITKGLMRSFSQIPNGNQKTYVISCEHNLFTEHCSFITQKPSLDSIEALEDTDVLYFSYLDLMNIYKKSHELESVGRKISDINFAVAKNRFRSLMNDDAPSRYLQFLHSYQNLLDRIPQNIVASYLGITPQSLSRLKREIENK